MAGLISDSAVAQALVESKGDVAKAIEALAGARTKESARREWEMKQARKANKRLKHSPSKLHPGGTNAETVEISDSNEKRRLKNEMDSEAFRKQFEALRLAPKEPNAGPRAKPESKELSTRVTKKRIPVNNTGKVRRILMPDGKFHHQGMGPDAGPPKRVTSLPIFRQRQDTVLTTVDVDRKNVITPRRTSTFAGFSSDPTTKKTAMGLIASVMFGESFSEDDTETVEELEKGVVGVLETMLDEAARREHRLTIEAARREQRRLQKIEDRATLNMMGAEADRKKDETDIENARLEAEREKAERDGLDRAKYIADKKARREKAERERAERIRQARLPQPDVDLTGQPVFRTRIDHGTSISLYPDDDDWQKGKRVNEMASARTRKSVRTKR
jgi:hypothetical protein